jgi:ribonuclease Z
MHHANALAQITLRLGAMEISGFSLSGLATYVQIPSLDVCFDLGECPLSALPLNHVFLTHAHGDHARCLPRHWQLRKMLGMTGEATYFLPEAIRPAAEEWIRAEARFEGVPEPDIVLPDLRGLVADAPPTQLPRKRDLLVRAFPVTHRVPSLGYTLLQKKRKLRPDFADVPGPEIARLRRQGVEVHDEVLDPVVTFIGDCIGASLIEQAHIWSSRVLILEATFLSPGEELLAAAKGHTHLSEVAAALEHFGDRVTCEHLVLKHFSMRYAPDEVARRVDEVIPPRFRERVRLLL